VTQTAPLPSTDLPLDDIRLGDIEQWMRPDRDGIFAKLRAERPVSFHAEPVPPADDALRCDMVGLVPDDDPGAPPGLQDRIRGEIEVRDPPSRGGAGEEKVDVVAAAVAQVIQGQGGPPGQGESAHPSFDRPQGALRDRRCAHETSVGGRSRDVNINTYIYKSI